MVDFRNKSTSGVPEITPEIATGIYDLIKQYGTADLAYKNQSGSVYYNKHFSIVNKEIDRLYNEMTSKLSGSFVIEEAVPAEYDEEGNVVKEAEPTVYFNVGKESDFIDSLSSDLLDVSQVYSDFKGSLTWAALKNKYKIQE